MAKGTLLSSLDTPALVAVAESYRTQRVTTAARTYRMYQIIAESAGGFLLESPPSLRGESPRLEAETYHLHPAQGCNCPDTTDRLNPLNTLLSRRGADIDPVLCKHWHIVALIRARHAEIAEAEAATRREAAARAAVRVSAWQACTLFGTVKPDGGRECWTVASLGRCDDGFPDRASAEAAASRAGLVIVAVRISEHAESVIAATRGQHFIDDEISTAPPSLVRERGATYATAAREDSTGYKTFTDFVFEERMTEALTAPVFATNPALVEPFRAMCKKLRAEGAFTGQHDFPAEQIAREIHRDAAPVEKEISD